MTRPLISIDHDRYEEACRHSPGIDLPSQADETPPSLTLQGEDTEHPFGGAIALEEEQESNHGDLTTGGLGPGRPAESAPPPGANRGEHPSMGPNAMDPYGDGWGEPAPTPQRDDEPGVWELARVALALKVNKRWPHGALIILLGWSDGQARWNARR